MNETTDATAIFAPLWRRKWLILLVGVIVGVASYFYYKGERPTYQSTTQLYFPSGVEESASSEKGSSKGQGASLSYQAAVINTLVVESVRRTLRAQHQGELARTAIARAKSPEKTQFIDITTEAHTPKGSALFANLLAQAYVKRQRVQRDEVIERSISITRRQLRRIEAASVPKVTAKSGASKGKAPTVSAPSTSSILQAANLNSKINQLESSLLAPGAQQIKPAKPTAALMLSPKPRKNAIFGFVLGLVLAAIAAYAISRFDRRLRTLAGIEAVFGAPILAAVPKVGRPVVHRDGLAAPSKLLVEPLRRMHTALMLGDQVQAPRVIILISPDAGDGKSTLVADLALVQRDAGARVAVIEANFRRPAQARLLGLSGAHGLAEVLSGRLAASEAMERVMPIGAQANGETEEEGAGVLTAIESRAGSLFLLAGSGGVPNPPALLAGEGMADLLRATAGDFDYVLIDVPSPLEASDAMPLLKLVDGIVIVGRVGHTREASSQRLMQLLAQTASAPVIGVAANCVPRSDIERSGFSSSNGRAWSRKLFGR